jgi:hypothetical protein
MKTKIVFYNPHKIWFKETVRGFKAKTRQQKKYDYLIDEHLLSNNEIFFFIDQSQKADLFNGPLFFLNNNFIEFWIWILLSRIPIKNVRLINSLERLSHKDAVILFAYGHFNFNDQNKILNSKSIVNKLNKSEAKKIIHISHFGYNTSYLANSLREINKLTIVSECDLKATSKLFNKHFKWYKDDVCILPYVPETRFKSLIKFEDRSNKVLAYGTLTHPMTDTDFLEVYPKGILQPMRQELYLNKEKLKNILDCNITPIGENIQNTPTLIKRIISRLLIDFLTLKDVLNKILISNKNIDISKDRAIFKKDIVQEMNRYKYAVVPEEIIGIPAISAFEAMKCGCVLIGHGNGIYESLGMQAYIHYFPYNGTISGLEKALSKLNSDVKLAKLISERGKKFSDDLLNQKAVFSKFLKHFQ